MLNFAVLKFMIAVRCRRIIPAIFVLIYLLVEKKILHRVG